MQDSDDLYFGQDDLFLDDDALAALDEAERKYVSSQAPFATQQSSSRSPPPKRVKLEHTSEPQPTRRKRGRNALDEVPDISLNGGAYTVLAGGPPKAAFKPPSPTIVRVPDSQRLPMGNQFIRKPVSHPSRTSAISKPPIAGPSNSRMEVISRHASGPILGSQYATLPTIPATPAASQDLRQRTQSKSGPEAELARLKRQIQMLNAQLEDSRNQVLSRAGEVAVLRTTIQETADTHAAQLAKIEDAKNQAETARIKLRDEYKHEIERMKTLYSFRQHEVDTSARRPPMSAHKFSQASNATPMRVPAEIRSWNSKTRDVVPPLVAETPGRPAFGNLVTPRRPVASSQRIPNRSQLLGFVNSFTQPSPSQHLSQLPKAKTNGKERANDDDVFLAPPSPPSPTRYGQRAADVPDLPMLEIRLPSPAPEAEEAAVIPVEQDEDVPMSPPTAPRTPVEDFVQETYIAQPSMWLDKIHRFILGHTLASTEVPTLQLLMTSSLPSSAPAEDIQAYAHTTARLLESVASASSLIEWSDHLRELLRLLSNISMLLILHGADLPLTALFNMLRRMSYSIPSFTEILLSPLPQHEEDPCRILIAMRDAVRRYAVINQDEPHGTTVAMLASEAVALLEALSWNIPEPLVPRLFAFVRAPQVLITLLGPKRPAALVRDTARTLAILATHPNAFRQLLAHPYTEAGQRAPDAEDTRSIEHLDQLYAYLTDAQREADLKDAILTFIATVALAHTDAVTILLQSYILIPSIITYLTDITNPLWEEDPGLMASQAKIDWAIQTTNRLVALLSYLVFSSPTPYNLRYKLHHLPHRRFNGISHMFTVTMSRLSFADPPSWLLETQKVQLEHTMDMATKLLELLVDGPELEVAWSAFQVDSDSKAETEEEREARLLHPDDAE